MKSRKVSDYNDIQQECKKLITLFTPDPRMIKTKIESLIEREYI